MLAADCTTDTLPVLVMCVGVSTIEMGEITDVIFDDIDSGSTPANPITGWVNTGLVNDAVNSAAITTWFASIDNTTAGGLKHIK